MASSTEQQSRITIEEARPDSPDSVELLRELDEHLWTHPYPPESRHAYSIDKLLREGVAFFVLRFDGNAAGCGGVQLFGNEYGEVKRMFVRRPFRRLGLGKAILDRLGEHTKERGAALLRLETGIYETEAIALYERYGFQRRGPFGEYRLDPMTVYFEKLIG